MRSIFAIWSDNGRIDYGVSRPRLPRVRRLAIATAVFLVAGIGLSTVYSAIVTNSKMHDGPSVNGSANADSSKRDAAYSDANRDSANENRHVADAAPAPRPRAITTKRRMLSKTIGLVPIGSLAQSTIAESPPSAGSAANPPVASADVSARATTELTDREPPKLVENKLRDKAHVAKKKSVRSASALRAHGLADGRQVVMRRPPRNDAAAFDPGNDNFTNVPRFGRRIYVAQPWLFDGPF